MKEVDDEGASPAALPLSLISLAPLAAFFLFSCRQLIKPLRIVHARAWLNWPSFNFLGNLRAPEQSSNLSRMNVCCELLVEGRIARESPLIQTIVKMFELVPRRGTVDL